ncbi:ChbG/HpnK family deacetylase [Steroidobacter cummioxidans]|uniref:ChbG/HpnK family deacetylase n=1 Tax=Steroidobacter cummioxidans TaxID=1803913 RepID=UPI000E30BC5E|nr:ChbG/HpnK family deacetylase [Steroidobacter cummioxidans]
MSEPRPVVSKRVVVCADDFGFTDVACEAIIELAAAGAVSAVSCAVDGAATPRHALALLAVSSDTSLGLHFNLTEPATAPAHARLDSWLWRAQVVRSIDTDQVRVELRRQLSLFESLFARPPDFVDGHEHVHQLHAIAPLLVDELSARYGIRVAVRSTLPLHFRGIKASVIAQLGGRQLSQLLHAHGLTTNADFAGVYDFSAHVPYARRMQQWLISIADRGLIMCHPERPTPKRTDARALEYIFFCSDAWRRLRQHYSIRLVQFSGTE